MSIFTRKKRARNTALGYFMSADGDLPAGYHRLLDCPEIAACVDFIANIISSTTIHLMEDGRKGYQRVYDELARFVDVDPMPGMGTRATFLDWIVSTMLTTADGTAYVLPEVDGGLYSCLRPMPGASLVEADGKCYVSWQGNRYLTGEVLIFRLHADPDRPWRGRGICIPAKNLAASLASTESLKRHLSSPNYKPPLIVSMVTDSDLSDPAVADAYRDAYLKDTADGKPWILPEGLMKVEQIRPLSLADLAVKDTVELDKKAVCSLIGCPGFVLGIGSYSAAEFNNCIRTRVIPIVTVIEQVLTLGLLESPRRFFRMNRRRLYDYDLKTLIDIDNSMADRGYLNGDEVREDAFRDPAGLTEYKVLENYIPYDMSGKQKKLESEGENNA